MSNEQMLTRRSVSPYMERVLFEPRKVLDHGSVTVISYDGVERDIAQAARTSYQGGTKTVTEDAALLRRLLRDQHTSPFEQATIRAHVKMPIFVARQWVRHRMQSINEVSARYSVLDNEFYIPAPEHLAPQSKSNKQGRAGELNADQRELVRELLREDALRAYDDYGALLGNGPNDHFPMEYPGISRELARMNLSLNFYTTWVMRQDVNNLMKFLRLRMDGHAQYEIRVYANVLGEVFEGWMPNIYQAFRDFMLDSYTVSGPMLEMLKSLLKNTATARGDMLSASVHETTSRLYPQCTKSEVNEFLNAIGVKIAA